ncbi:hypothetical protein BJV82DRAFT_252621 [Fennellomyces sp. T-0311]|nr:hypothetical protein BJV82DRAFT_252621 [Fennellomyces sp. T-0311]
MTTATPRYSPYASTPAWPKSSPSSSPPPVQIFDLQDVLAQYQTQPELLKLILSSKVEEDKRRTEEAKLRAKELDLYLKEDRSHKRNNSMSSHSSNSSISSSGSNMSNSGRRQSMLRVAPYPPPSRETIDDHQERRNSAAVAMVAMGTLSHTASPPSPSFFPASPSISSSTTVASAYPSPAAEYYSSSSEPSHNTNTITTEEKEVSDNAECTSPVTGTTSTPNHITTTSGRARRRREMQAITKIVETREFPYQDRYFWKNNGNTTQRKTGCKSIYYKCSNSNKGCPVNKTVTERPNGEYIIKYRGQHLAECGRVERIVDL